MQKNYNASKGQSIYDVTLNAYGTLDNIVKLLQDSGDQGVDDVPASNQLYFFDDSLVKDQAVNQAYTLSGIKYATLVGGNGSYYVILQDKQIPSTPSETATPGGNNPVNEDFMIGQTQFVSNADGTTVISPVDADGNSMIGYDVIALELEIRPIENLPTPNQKWSWNKITATLSLHNGEVVDNGQTLFILYNKPA